MQYKQFLAITKLDFVGFKVLTVVTRRRFGGTYRLRHQGLA
jgi:hypothetical protein